MIKRYYVATEWMASRRWASDHLTTRGSPYTPVVEELYLEFYNEKTELHGELSIDFMQLNKRVCARLEIFEDGFKALAELGQPFLDALAKLDSHVLGHEATPAEVIATLNSLGFVRKDPKDRDDD